MSQILIIGGTGKTGARVDARLQAQGVLDGRNSRVADGVEATLGRPARDFTDYARRTTATGVWRA